MSRDPLGSDPLNLDPVALVSTVSAVSKSKELLSILKQGIVARGMYVLPDHEHPELAAPVGPPVGQDGQALTLEMRRKIAAQRMAYDPSTFGHAAPRVVSETLSDGRKVSVTLDYHADLPNLPVEALGASAQAEINKMPALQIHQTRELVTPDQAAEYIETNQGNAESLDEYLAKNPNAEPLGEYPAKNPLTP